MGEEAEGVWGLINIDYLGAGVSIYLQYALSLVVNMSLPQT